MTNAKDKSSLLLSWPFLLALAALLSNDLYLKFAYPGPLTGKLSDFAGIFLVSLIAFYWFPRRKIVFGTGIVLTFVWWKSPLSQPLIDAVNSLGLIQYGRVVDYSDLTALLVVPLAKITIDHCLVKNAGRALRVFISAPVALLAFVSILATSALAPEHEYSLRSSDPENRPDVPSLYYAIERVAKKYDVACVECDPDANHGLYRGGGLYLEYWLLEPDIGVRFRVAGSQMKGILLSHPDYTLVNEVRNDLRREFADLAPGMEYVESLSGNRQ